MRVIEEQNRDDDEAETVDDLLENILCGKQRNGTMGRETCGIYEGLIFKVAYIYL